MGDLEPRFLEPDDLDDIGAVSELLRHSFQEPYVHYRPDVRRFAAEQLRWHLQYPSPLRPRLLTLRDGHDLAGCLALWPRRVGMDGSVHDVYVLTWVAVAERFRGLGVGQRLYSVALETAGDSAMLVFAEAESAGDLLLRKCLSRSRGILHPLGAYQALGVVCRESRRPVHEAGDLRPGEIDSLPGAAGAIAAMPSAAQVQHHAAYPLRSAWIAVRDSAGRIVGAVFGLLPEGGSGAVAVVLAVGSPDVNGAALPEVAGAFARILGRQPVIVVENDRFVDRAAIRTVVRPLGPSFNGYLHCGAAHPLAQAHHTISEML